MPALKQLLNLIKHIVKQAMSKAEKAKIIKEMQSAAELTKLLVGSIVSCHQKAVELGEVGPALLIDGRYTHKEV